MKCKLPFEYISCIAHAIGAIVDFVPEKKVQMVSIAIGAVILHSIEEYLLIQLDRKLVQCGLFLMILESDCDT